MLGLRLSLNLLYTLFLGSVGYLAMDTILTIQELLSSSHSPANVYYKGCEGEASFCDPVNRLVEKSNIQCHGCLIRPGTYPVTIKMGRVKDTQMAIASIYSLHSEIILSDKIDWVPNSITFESTILHELGHTYNIPHSVFPNDVMYKSESNMVDGTSLFNFLIELEKQSKIE